MRSRLKCSSGIGNAAIDFSEPYDASGRTKNDDVGETSRATRNRRPSNRGRQTQLQYQSLEPRQLLAADFLITEFQASNDSTLLDDSGRNSDWIEIYNAGNAAGNLSGYSLTDDASDTTKWTFPSGVLQPNDFLVVFAEDDANVGSGSDFYTGFKLSASGEYLGLFDPSGNVVSQYDSNAGEYPAQQSDGSYGLAFTSGGSPSLVQPVVEGYFLDPTPGEANSLQFEGVVAPVNVSADAGFYETQFPLTLTTATPGANIRFTIDGSTPTETNGFNYSSAFPIPSSLNLRAIAFKDDFIPSPIATRTYLFLDDVLGQASNGSAPAGWPSSWGGNDVDYGLDQEVIDQEGEQVVKDALLSIPTWSITTDLANLFDQNTGIYANANQDGQAWERPASVELINPDGEEGFQIDAGLRIRGGFSRSDSNPKHSFRLFFRSEYGQSTLEYPIHGEEGVDEFRRIDLRTAQNYSWSFQGDARNNFVQDVLARNTQRDLGQPYTRSSWLHLYLNGQYWGLYQTQERAEANFAASYFGGDADDYDVIKHDNLSVNAVDGNISAYNRLSTQAHARAADGVTPAFVDDAEYYKAQGLNTDGTDNPTFEPLLDVDNLISYMMVILAGGNLDAPISNFIRNERINNFYAIRDRTGSEGFKFFAHDSEHTLLNVNENRNGPFNHPNFDNGHTQFNPQWLHQQLMANEEYRIRFADHVQAAFFNGGPLSVDAQIARLDEETAKIDQAIIGESIRWGDAQRNDPFDRSDWVNAINNIRNNYFPNRSNVVLEQFRNTVLRLETGNNTYNNVVDAPLFPDVDAPVFLVNGTPAVGGNVGSGTSVIPTSEEGTVWYTTDGSDPRLVGGSINGNALPFDGSTTNVNVVSAGSNWRYEDTGTDLGTAWRSANYNDSGWSQGDAELGYGDGEETTVSFGSNSNDKYPTTYFRQQFNAPTGDIVSVKLRVVRDDGIAVYLNGTEIVRDNLPGGTIGYGTTALNVVSNEDESDFFEFTVPVSALLPGATNTLAVEVHQYAPTQGGSVTSSDVSFDAELVVSFAATASDSVVINESTTLKARTRRSDGTWSALQVANLVVPSEPASADNLRVTELQYHSRDSGVEYIEIQNITSGASATAIDLGGVTITDGPSSPFQFDAIASLAPQAYGLVVNDVAAFQAAYPNVDSSLILGEFTGALSNGGEQIRFETASGQTLLEFTYNDADPWPIAADGAGPSLQLVDPSATPADQLNKPYRWRASWEFVGNPGTAGILPSGIVINEVVANSDGTLVDSIELYNPTGQPINIGGWFLSDSKNELTTFQIQSGTVLAAGGHIVFDESDFNPTPPVPGQLDFALSGSSGDQIYLTRIVTTPTGLSLNFEAAVEFGATFAGESIGRLNDGVGRLVRLQQPTLGSANSAGKAGPLVISEANYHPSDPTATALAIDPTLQDDDLEFIEIHNPTVTAINLTDWRLRGDIDFDFAQSSLSGGDSLIVVSFDPNDANAVAAFRAHYGITGGSFVGPWSGGSLSNGYGRVALQSPDVPSPDAPTVVPHVVVDELLYDDVTAELDTDGGGDSLTRIANARNGNDPDEWFGDQPTPGSVDVQPAPPTIISFVRDESSEVRPDLLTTLEVAFSENVSLSASSLSLFNDSTGGNSVDLSGIGFTYDLGSRTATWDFSTLPNLDAAFYSAVLDAGQIQSSASGLLLDGDNDGTQEGDYETALYVAIPGDTDLDGDVDVLGDAFKLIQNLGTANGMIWADGDFDGDGDVDILDSNPSIGDGFLFVANIGKNVRPGETTALQSTDAVSSPLVQAATRTSELNDGLPILVAQMKSSFGSSDDETRREPNSNVTVIAAPILTLSGMTDTASSKKASLNVSASDSNTQGAAIADVTESLDEVFADQVDPFV